VQIVAGQQLVLVQPAADALALKPVMQQTGKCLILVAVADEAGREPAGLIQAPRARMADVMIIR
jgi:hypothetical protein